MKPKKDLQKKHTGYLDQRFHNCIHENDCEAFVLKYIDFVYYIVLKFRPSVEEYEVAELVHDIFIELLKNNREKLRKYDVSKGLSLRSWINMIATRTVINALRKKKRSPILDTQTTEPNNHLADELKSYYSEGNHLMARIETLIETLPKRYRLFFDLFYYQNMELAEIADFLKITRDNVYSMKYKAIKCLKKKLSKGE